MTPLAHPRRRQPAQHRVVERQPVLLHELEDEGSDERLGDAAHRERRAADDRDVSLDVGPAVDAGPAPAVRPDDRDRHARHVVLHAEGVQASLERRGDRGRDRRRVRTGVGSVQASGSGSGSRQGPGTHSDRRPQREHQARDPGAGCPAHLGSRCRPPAGPGRTRAPARGAGRRPGRACSWAGSPTPSRKRTGRPRASRSGLGLRATSSVETGRSETRRRSPPAAAGAPARGGGLGHPGLSRFNAVRAVDMPPGASGAGPARGPPRRSRGVRRDVPTTSCHAACLARIRPSAGRATSDVRPAEYGLRRAPCPTAPRGR